MPRNTKSTAKVATHEADDSSDEEVMQQTKTTTSKAKTGKKASVVLDNESDDEEVVQETKSSKPVTTSKAKTTKKAVTNSSAIVNESDDDEVNDVNVEADEDDEEDVEDADDASDEENDTKDKKKNKKTKESFDSLTKSIDSERNAIKVINKEIGELEKTLKIKIKERNDHERQLNNTLKLLGKTHSEEVTKALKERPKRKGNVNGGFNKEHPVPEILRTFLGLPENAAMARPKVMSALNNKFTELNLKEGQNTTIDKATAKALNLGKAGEGKVIKFTEFQTFLASFYPSKTEIEVVV